MVSIGPAGVLESRIAMVARGDPAISTHWPPPRSVGLPPRRPGGPVACREREKDHIEQEEWRGVNGQTYLRIRVLAALCI
ncbi:hypothetical protein GCM10010521_06530 [Streptomyces rameus]|uniref:Uncharacterized protein n=1 Tax=Streptomyces rameus TaxID=68261 RepID=A0ABP6MR40_9ACTN